tara:strand:- start:3297 stop:3434 length:138 start_codon:yes stop_codon:yes gene_type:complete
LFTRETHLSRKEGRKEGRRTNEGRKEDSTTSQSRKEEMRGEERRL